ncbi:dimethyl sulfoxide reductase [Klebsiella quasipneumoniae]|nr:dimethyl sulfoxide reductase [Klebsiella quasipneumoniae]
MPAQACRHDENVLLVDEIFRLKLTPGFINKLRKTIAYYLLPHLSPFCG